MRLTKLMLVSMSCGAACFSLLANAAQPDTWQFEITPYLLAAGMDGKVGVRGVTSDVDMSFGDVWDNLDSAFMGLFTARKGPWVYGLEGIYVKLEGEDAKSVSGPFGEVTVNGALEVTTSMYIYQGTVGYRVLDGVTTVDLLGALRYTKLDADMNVVITTTPGIVFPGGARSAGGSESWTDGVIGVRVLYQLNDQWSLLGYADAGGGESDFTYQFMLGANWEFTKDFIAKAGYRQLYWDYEDDGTVWDMTVNGPYLGLGIRF